MVEPKLALRSAPPRANPLTLSTEAISEIFFIDIGVSSKAMMSMSGRLDINPLSSTLGNIYALIPRLESVNKRISS